MLTLLLSAASAASVAGSAVGGAAVSEGEAATAAPAATASAVWASHPVRSNETLMLQGYGAVLAPGQQPTVTLETWSEATKTWQHAEAATALPSAAHSTSGISVVLPDTTPGAYTAYRASIGDGSAGNVTVNVPEIWWALGDAGKAATNGGKGWLRIFGRSIHLTAGPGRSDSNGIAQQLHTQSAPARDLYIFW